MTGSAIEYKVPSIPTLSGIFCKGNLEDLTNRLSAVTEFSFTIVDSNEQEIIKTKNNNRYCKECCAKNCGQCQIHNELYKLKEAVSCDPILITCFKGLCGVAIPIWLDGHYLGAFVGGRIRIQGRKPLLISSVKSKITNIRKPVMQQSCWQIIFLKHIPRKTGENALWKQPQI